jgi:hypothetical protein
MSVHDLCPHLGCRPPQSKGGESGAGDPGAGRYRDLGDRKRQSPPGTGNRTTALTGNAKIADLALETRQKRDDVGGKAPARLTGHQKNSSRMKG